MPGAPGSSGRLDGATANRSPSSPIADASTGVRRRHASGASCSRLPAGCTMSDLARGVFPKQRHLDQIRSRNARRQMPQARRPAPRNGAGTVPRRRPRPRADERQFHVQLRRRKTGVFDQTGWRSTSRIVAARGDLVLSAAYHADLEASRTRRVSRRIESARLSVRRGRRSARPPAATQLVSTCTAGCTGRRRRLCSSRCRSAVLLVVMKLVRRRGVR